MDARTKARIILYGWALSWLFLFAGIGTMEQGGWVAGALLCTVWFAFSFALIANEDECGKEADRLEAWFDRTFGDKDNNQGLGFG